MKHFISFSAIISFVLADPGFVQLPVSVGKGNLTSSTLKSRSAGESTSLDDAFTGYYVEVELGTPGQAQIAQIDTGSSDLWVYGPQSSGASHFYDHSKSSTSKYVSDSFSVSYVDGSSSAGDYYTDNSSLGGIDVNFQFAVTEQPNSGYPVFGIASQYREADSSGFYPNYPVALQQQGLIESTAYSLYLNDLHATSGSLLFGGVDTSKYSGQLYTVPITSEVGFNVDFEVEGHRINGILDCGTSFTYLPDDIANGLAQQVGATWNYKIGAYFVDEPTDLSLTYSFSGAEITVPSSELFVRWDNGITFTIGPSSHYGGSVLLGDSFLRSAYVVYDLDNSQIGIAQADYNGSGSIEPITSAGIPGSQPAPGF